MNRTRRRGERSVTRAVFLLMVVISAACASVVPVTTTVCKPASCTGDNCPQVSCEYGNCSPEGLCVCSSCFSGQSCSTYKNDYYPQLTNAHEQVTVSTSLVAGDLVFKLSAVDPDTTLTCGGADKECPCAQIVYAIESGNTDDLFAIDARTGLITATRTLSQYSGHAYKLYVSVVNRAVELSSGISGGDIVGPKSYGLVTVGVGDGSLVESTQDEDESAGHLRYRRGVPYVNNITFALIKTGVYNSTTTMKVGSKVHFQMQITFPAGVIDLLVELFTPDNDTTVMLLCSPVVKFQGSAITFTGPGKPVLDSLDGSYNYDRAVIDFGNVTCAGTGAVNVNDTQIFIEWDAVMIEAAVNNTQYWVSAGAEYNNHDEIWIGQAGFTTFKDSYSAQTQLSQFNLSGPANVMLGTSSTFHVDMYLPAPMTDVTFEAFAPINYTDTVSMCSVIVVGVGKNYGCLQYDKLTYVTYNSDSMKTNERARMYLGSVVNSGSRESPATPYNDSLISIEFSVFVPVNTSLVGTTLWIGAAVEISSDHIWAGEIGVGVLPATNATAIAGVTYTINSSVSAAVRSPFLIEFNMTIPPYTDTSYDIAVSTPVFATNVAPLFKLCTIYISYQGVNVPCIYADRPLYKTTTGITPYDQVLWKLNRVVNTGQRSINLDPSANTVQVFMFFHPTNHSANIVGSVSTITTSVMVGDAAATTFMTNVTIATQTSNVTNSSSPVVATLFKFGTSSLQVNQSTDFRLTVTAFPKTLYYPVTLDITVPYDNGSTIFSICRVELLSVGLNLPCVNQTDVNATIQYYNTASYLGYYRASINLDSVCSIANLPANGTFIASTADTMEFSIIVRVENHPSLSNGSIKYVGSALNFTPSVSWQGSQPITVMKTPFMAYVNQTPYITAYRPMNTTFADTPVGSLTIYQVLFKIPPMSVADWTIRADVGTDGDITICSVAVKEFGRAIPCLNLTTPMRSITSTQGRKTAWLDLYKLTNVGNNTLFADPTFDNNTVVVEIVTQVATSAAIGSMHQINISVDHGMNGIDYSTIMLLNVSAPAAAGIVLDAPLPNTTFNRIAVTDNATTALNVVKGETIILVTEISVPFKSRNDFNITFATTTADVINFGSVDVVYIGSNIPCLIKQRFNATINALSATINLGTACHWPVDPSAAINDKIRVEAIVTVKPNATGSSFSITSVLQVNGTNQPADTLAFIIDTGDFIEYTNPLTANMANIIFNVSNSSISNIFPNDNFTVVIDVIVPANSTVFGLVDINVPNDLMSAVMTISQVTLNSVGVNLGSYVNLPADFPIICQSKLNTSQMDHCYVNFGKLSNTGHTYRSDKYQYGDDNLRFTVTLRMADASVNDKNYISYMNVGANLGLPMFFRDLGVQLNRNLNEMPTILFQPALNSTVGRLLTVDVLIYHSNTSRAEAFNTTVFFYLTKYVVFKRLVMSSYIGKAPNVTNMTDNEAVSIGFDHICFTDVFIVRLELLVIDTTTATGVDVFTNIAMEAKYFMYFRSGHTIVTVAGTPLASDIAYTNFTAAPQRVAPCAGVALGMESGALTDCQLSASESPDTAHKAVNGRISGTGWSSASRLGNFMRYFQVHFANLTQVTYVTLQNPYTSNTFGSYAPLQTFALWYSNDGINWTPGINQFTVSGNLAARTNVSIPPMEQKEAAYVRLEIISPAQSPSSAMVALKVEFSGCATGPLPITAPELCNVRDGFQKSTVADAAFYKRGFLVVSGPPTTVYMCDSKPSGDMQCYSSADGLSWIALDKLIHNIVGYLPSINQLYALDSSHNAFLLSEDNGLTWITVSAARFQWAKLQTGFINPVVVPWLANAGLSTTGPSSTYLQTPWGANYNGLYNGVNIAADWSACCAA